MIKHIVITNLKGLTGSFDLAPVTIVTAKQAEGKTLNSRGKSAVLNAVALVMMGYLPSLGKQAQSTFQLSSGAVMSVGTDDVQLSWKSAGGKVSSKVPDGFVAAPESMIDLDAFFSQTISVRMNSILRACAPPAQYNVHNIKSKLKALAPSWSPSAAATDELSLVDWMDVVEKDLKGRLSLLRASVKERESAVAVICEELTKVDAAQSVEQDVKAAQKALSVAGQAFATARTQFAERETVSKQLDELKVNDLNALQEEINTLIAALPKQATGADAAMKKSAVTAREKVGRYSTKQLELKRQIQQLAECKTCPTCSSPVGEELLKTLQETLADITETLEAAREASKTADALVVAADKAAAAHNQEVQSAERVISQKRGRLDALKSYAGAQEQLVIRLNSLPTADDVEKLKNEHAAAQAKLDDLTVKQKLWVSQQGRRNDARDMQAGLQKLQSDLAEITEAAKELSVTREAVITSVIGSLLSVANRVAQPALGAPIEWRDGDFAFGRATRGTMSGSERMIIYAGLQVAITAGHANKVVIMDDLERIADDRKELLLQAIEKCVADGLITQFIGADLRPLTAYPDTFGVITL